MRLRLRHIGLGAGVVALVLLCGALWRWQAGPLPLAQAGQVSTLVVDREGRLLRPFATKSGMWRLPVEPAMVDQRFLRLLAAYEDQRFDSHSGVDPRALLRAAGQYLRHGRIVSGGSTLSMQAARLLEPRAERSFGAKLRQIARAIELESQLSKQDILKIYLTLAPYGGNIEGVRAASLAYLGKEPRRLSLGEAALLIALPQAPEARRPDRSASKLRRARDLVLERLHARGVLSAAEIAGAKLEAVPTQRLAFPMLAPHLAEREAGQSGQSVVRLTIDARLQASLEALVRERARSLGPSLSLAMVAIDNASGEVRAYIGSPDYFDRSRAGAVDMVQALRSPGSALKPFVYAIAFEQGIAHPETLFEDRPVRYGTYAPENFDQKHQGTVSARQALQMSLNIPVVELMQEVRPGRFVAQLRGAGAEIALPGDAAPGLAAGLGGLGIRLLDMTRLYAGLARGGETLSAATRPSTTPPERRALTNSVAAWYVADILRGTPPPDHAIGGRFSYKTGTSYGYRDAWAVGFDGKWTIGVWAGRADGAPVAGLTGRQAAAPLLFEAFARTLDAPVPIPAPRDALQVAGSALPPPLRQFANRAGMEGLMQTQAPLRLVFPPDGARVELAGDLVVRAEGGALPLSFMVDDAPAGSTGLRRSLSLTPKGRGFSRLTVIDARGASASVMVRFE